MRNVAILVAAHGAARIERPVGLAGDQPHHVRAVDRVLVHQPVVIDKPVATTG